MEENKEIFMTGEEHEALAKEFENILPLKTSLFPYLRVAKEKGLTEVYEKYQQHANSWETRKLAEQQVAELKEAKENGTLNETRVKIAGETVEQYINFHRDRAIVAEKKNDAYVSFRRAVPGEEIVSIDKNGVVEGTVKGREDLMVVTRCDKDGNPILNKDGKPNTWTIEEDIFKRTFSADEKTGIALPKQEKRIFLQVDRDIDIPVSWADNGIQHVPAGGYLNITNEKDVYGIGQEEFKETYNVVEQSKESIEMQDAVKISMFLSEGIGPIPGAEKEREKEASKTKEIPKEIERIVKSDESKLSKLGMSVIAGMKAGMKSVLKTPQEIEKEIGHLAPKDVSRATVFGMGLKAGMESVIPKFSMKKTIGNLKAKEPDASKTNSRGDRGD